jgi:hypothetical protein
MCRFVIDRTWDGTTAGGRGVVLGPSVNCALETQVPGRQPRRAHTTASRCGVGLGWNAGGEGALALQEAGTGEVRAAGELAHADGMDARDVTHEAAAVASAPGGETVVVEGA